MKITNDPYFIPSTRVGILTKVITGIVLGESAIVSHNEPK